MGDYIHAGVFGVPGSGKTKAGLSFPGVELHVFGSSEEYSIKNFPARVKSGDILKPIKLDWMDFLKPEEKEKLFKEDSDDIVMANIKKVGVARKIRNYRRYLLLLKDILKTNKRPELKTVFLDNGTPFLDEYRDWFDVVFEKKYITDKGNYDSIKASIDFASEVSDFIKEFNELECNTVMSFHVEMAVSLEDASKVNFMKDGISGIKYAKEFQPMVTGKMKYHLAGKFDYAFFLASEENPGLPNKYIAKLEADSANVGIAKGRIQPFPKGSRIELPDGTFYDFLNKAIETKLGSTSK